MTNSTITAIVLAFFLGLALVVALYQYKKADNLLRTNRSQHIKICAYRDANRDPNATYHVQRVQTDLPEFRQYNGCWGVCRRIANRGYMFATTIKVFTDEDDDFNHREAEELCDKLNEK